MVQRLSAPDESVFTRPHCFGGAHCGSHAAPGCPATMPLTLLVGTVALTLVGHADSVRAVTKPNASGTPASVSAADAATAVSKLDTRFPVDSIVVEKAAHRLSLYQ